MSENKIENADKKTTSENGSDDKPENEEIDAVVGGYMGKNWHKGYNDTLFRLSIIHKKHLFIPPKINSNNFMR